MNRSERPVVIGAVLACVALFFAYAFIPLAAPPRFSSPDEASNSFFVREFATTGKLWHFDPLNLIAPGIVHPRSVRVVDDLLVPGGFLGLIVLYGGLAAIFGLAAVPYFTAFFAVAGGVVWGALVAHFFGKRAGTLAGALLLIEPAWWYESSRPLFPNVLFMTLLFAAAWCFFATPLRRSSGAVAGALFGLALATRTSEIYWLALGIAALAARNYKRIPWLRTIAFFAAAALAFAPFLFLNKTLYGSYVATGYGAVGAPVVGTLHGRGEALLGPLAPILFPLGFAPRTAIENAWTYGVAFFGWWSLIVGAAVAWLAARRRPLPAALKNFFIVASVASAYLVFFYGSWTIHDNPDPHAVTIGSSYLRYWLPIFAASTVPIAIALDAIAARLAPRRQTVILVLVLFAVAAASGVTVFGAKDEGLLAMRDALIRDDAAAKEIVARTPPDAVVIVDRADKYVFPERSVIVPLRSDATYAALGALVARIPVYYFGLALPPADLAYLRQTTLAPQGLAISPVEATVEGTLYRIDRLAK